MRRAVVSSAVKVAGTTNVSLSAEVANVRWARASGPSSNSDANPCTAAQQVRTRGLGSPAGASPPACASMIAPVSVSSAGVEDWATAASAAEPVSSGRNINLKRAGDLSAKRM